MNEQTLFAEALEQQDPQARAAFLDQACQGDPALRERIERLLAQHEHAGDFLESPAAPLGPTMDQAASDRCGTIIGQYKLLEQIGEGGFGVVYLAEQTEPVRRKVALKILKPGMDTRQIVARFEAERQALAIMDHPNIAKVFDGGMASVEPSGRRVSDEPNTSGLRLDARQASGRPYFVMELVKGIPITEYCDQNHLTPRQRLELFIPVCQAVQHAHQKGIIHRDLKPSNVLVTRHDSTPVPKVIDFGVAKALGQELTDKTLFTGIAQMVGTPLYMSPEQAGMSDLDVDTRSDIYSLGVLLYELLTGTTPFEKERFKKAAYDEIRRIIREEEPPKPSTRLSALSSRVAPQRASASRSDATTSLASVSALRQTEPAKLTKLVRGELDWIVMKALEKDRNRRYETANGFAMDVQRYLADEAVHACPPSAGYRLKKFVRRNKGPVLAVSLVLLALVAGIVGTTWQAIRAANRAKGERLAKQRAEADFALANEAVEKYLGTVTDDADLKRVDLNRLRMKLLEGAIPFFQRIAERKSDDPDVEARRGAAYLRLASLHLLLGENEAAIQDAEAARAVFARLNADSPAAPRYRLGLAHSHGYLGRAWDRLGNLVEAKAASRRAVDLLDKLVAEFQNEPLYRRELAGSLKDLASFLHLRSERVEAEASLHRAKDILQELVNEFQKEPVYRRNLAQAHNNLGNMLSDPKEAEASLLLARDIQQTLVDEFPRDAGYRLDLAKHYHNLCNAYNRLRQPAKAVAAEREALKLLENLAHEFPTVPEYREGVGRAYSNLGDSLWTLGDREKAAEEYGRGIEVQKKLAADFPKVPIYGQQLAQSYHNLGEVLSDPRKRSAAYRQEANSREELVRQFPKEDYYRSALAESHNCLGAVLTILEEREGAHAAFRRALELWKQLVREVPGEPAYAVFLAGVYCNLGNLTRDSGQSEAALDWYQMAIAQLEPFLARKPPLASVQPFLRNSHWGRAQALDALEKYAEATRDWARALELDDGSARDNLRIGLAFSRLLVARAAKDAAGCLAVAAEYEALKPTLGVTLYTAAGLRALCADVIPHDPKSPAADAARLAKEQADLAMAWLHKAVAAGYRKASHMKQDQALDALREREDFKKLLAELENKKK